MLRSTNPICSFLDEPTAGLDPEAAADLIDYLKDVIRRLHTTVIICTHQLQGLESLCDDIGILKNGRLVAAGEVRRLLHQRWPERRYLLAVDGDLASAQRIVTSLVGGSVEIAAADGNLRFSVADEESISPVVAALATRFRYELSSPSSRQSKTSTSPQSTTGRTHDQPSAGVGTIAQGLA